jgi:malonate decarboxylase epsilon subunit
MSVLFTFPGQGAQKPGMLHALPDHAETRRTLDEAAIALGGAPLELDSAAALASTVAVQLCLLIAGVAMARVLAAHGGRPQMVAGLSIGAWPAAVVAEVLAFPDAVKLVELRATLMETAYPTGYGMTVITGLTRQQLEPLIGQVHDPARPVHLANLNAPRQLVIAGADEAMAAVAQLAKRGGAASVERIAMAVPSHCDLLAPQAEQLAAAVAQVPLQRPRCVYVSSSTARALFDGGRIGADLASNMAQRVRWYDTVRHAYERGARLAIEMPPGAVLSKLTEPVFEEGRAMRCSGDRLESILAAIDWETGRSR